MVVEDLQQPSDADAIAAQLQHSLAEPYQLGQHQFCATASIGVVLGPSIYSRAEDILRDADTAMYEAKRAGRARHIVFTDAKLSNAIENRCVPQAGETPAVRKQRQVAFS